MTKKIAVLAALIVLLLAGVGTVLLTGSRGREAPPAPSPEAAHAPEPADPDQDTPVEIGTKRSGRPADREAGTPGARMEVIVLWSDAKPAAGVALRVIAWDGPDPLNRAVMVRTDENGVARAEGLAGRHVTAYVDRGGSASAKVTGEGPVDAFPSVVIGIDGGVDYAGTVVDPEGRRVPGAEVWLSDYGNTARGVPVATTDDTGRFFVRCVRNSHWLRARADGHEPSNWMLTNGEAGGRRELRLVLGGPGGRLGGVVTDAAGVPIPGARVVAGGRPHEPVSGFDTTSGPDGAFVLDGLPVGEIAVGARAPGHAPFAGTVVLEPGSAVVVEWRLPAGARIEGVVRNSAGEPAPDAVVTSGRYGDFTTAMACADAAGRYVLVDVPPGRHEFSASLDGSGRASRTTDVTEGEVLRWDPVLHEGAILSGRVVDETGAPWAGILVEVRAGRSPGGAVDWATTDRDGRFRVSNVAGMVDIVVFTGPEDGPRSVLGRKPGVRPADGEVEIVVDRSRTPSARLEGRVLDDAGAPIHGARVFLRPAGEPMGTSVATESNGLFSAGPLPPGGYAIRVFFDGRPALDLGIRTLSAGEARNLGDLSMPAAGRVRVRIRREDDEPVKYAWGNVLGPDGLAPVSLSFEGGEALSGPVAPGRYAVRVDVTEPDRSFVAECAVVVREGETAEFDLVLRPAVRRTILVATPDGGAERSELALRITNSSGERVVSARHTPGVILAFLPGTYTVEAVTDDGRRAERMVNVREADTAPIEITLPER